MTGRAAGLCQWLCLAWLAALGATRAADDAGYRLYTEAVTIPERGEVTGYVLWIEGTNFSFIPPATWSVKYDPAKKAATILPPDLEAGITFVIAFEGAESRPDMNTKRLREKLLKRYPDARITEEFKCYTSGNDGLAFDFERVVDKEVRAAFRLAFIAFEDGTVEFELKTSSEQFPKYNHTFGNLLNSFRIKQGGRGG